MKKSKALPDPSYTQGALNSLIICLGPKSTGTGAEILPDVFLVFDAAHSLTELKIRGNRTPFLNLRLALKDVKSYSFFSFFLSTTSKIS